jgi:BrxA
MRYQADITAGALKLPESRVIASLLIRGLTSQGWREAIYERNVLQTRSPASARRLTRLIRGRLDNVDAELWRLVAEGEATVATHALLAAAIKRSALLGDFLDLVVREQYKIFSKRLTNSLWDQYLDDCRGRDPQMPVWHESTRRRLRSSVFQILAQAGFVRDTRSLKLQTVFIAAEVINYLKRHDEEHVLRCIQVSP